MFGDVFIQTTQPFFWNLYEFKSITIKRKKKKKKKKKIMIRRNYSNLPPGFRFHPTDEELIIYYLRNRTTSKPCPVAIIPEIDIYKFDPWELPERSELGESEWYFFTPRDRKYPNGVRPNRAAVSGYWKATGTDKMIPSGSNSKYVGVKKALVFYKGKPPKGVKTDWIMHEYRLNEPRMSEPKQNGSMRLDDLVLCRIYKKKNLGRPNSDQIYENTKAKILNSSEPQLHNKLPRTCSLTYLWDYDYINSFSVYDNSYNVSFNNQEIVCNNIESTIPCDFERIQQVQQYAHATNLMKIQAYEQQIRANPAYEMG